MYANSDVAYFGVRMVISDYGIGYIYLLKSFYDEDYSMFPVRAVLTIPSSALVEHAGTKSNPHTIQL